VPKNHGPSRSQIRKSKNRKSANARARKKLVSKDSELCLAVLDVPNINSALRVHLEREKLPIKGFEYYKLADACNRYLKRVHAEKTVKLELAAFSNQREDSDYSFLISLRDRPDWSVILKPKIGDSDIDDDICAYIDYFIEEHPVIRVILVGNDLKNHLPIAYKLVEQNISVTMLCFFDQFYKATLNRLLVIQGIDIIDITKFM